MKRLALLLLFLADPLSAEPRRFIVELRDDRASMRLERDLDGLRIRRTFTRAFNGAAVELAEGESVERLARLPYVLRVHPDGKVHAFNGPAPTAAAAVGRAQPNAGGTGIVVAVIDSGVDYSHPALGGGIGAGRKIIGGYDFVNDDSDPMDDNRHGTHVAGIIAAESDTVTGVAPRASLIAYKVLDARGNGDFSDVIAAIDRSMDPDQDGDPSDRADVINLSLGGPGNPDDPLSRAVERAVAAGIVVCVAAGNEGEYHRIGSPAGAASAITVGASRGTGEMAEFSSRGPATRSGAVKPDVIAPGASIVSTVPRGAYAALSGTSMATPHVAGLAALLVEDHPDWTPARVKAAIVASAEPLAGEEVMTQGSGIVDRVRALASDLEVAPTQINFGLDATPADEWKATRRITLHNESTGTRTVRLAASGSSGAVALELSATEIALAPGEQRELELRVRVDNSELGRPPTASLSFGGHVALTWDGGAAYLPWAFVRAGRATVTYSDASPNVFWSIPASRYASFAVTGPNGVEILVEPGTYELAVVAAREGDVRVIVAGEQKIEGDVLIALTPADAPHEIRLESFRDRTGASTLYSILGRLLTPGGSLPLVLKQRTFHASSFTGPYALLLTEAFVDGLTRTVGVAQHAPLRDLSGAAALRIEEHQLAAQPVRVRVPRDATGSATIQIMPRDVARRVDELPPQPDSLTLPVATGEWWAGTLLMNAEPHANYASGVQMAVRAGFDSFAAPSVVTPVIRRDGEGFFAVRGFGSPVPSSRVMLGEELSFGDGALYAPVEVIASPSALIGTIAVYGARNETRRRDASPLRVRVFDSTTGALLESGEISYGGSLVPLPREGALRVEMSAESYSIDGRDGVATLTLTFDTTTGEKSPPLITSLAVVDGTGRGATALAKDGNGTLLFSAADHESLAYRRVVDAATAVFFRPRGTTTWVQLTPVLDGEQQGGAGSLYRVDLRDALRVEGEIELTIEVADEQGNRASWLLSPAFVVGPASAANPRRRAVRH